jgi:hypothetical protein
MGHFALSPGSHAGSAQLATGSRVGPSWLVTLFAMTRSCDDEILR